MRCAISRSLAHREREDEQLSASPTKRLVVSHLRLAPQLVLHDPRSLCDEGEQYPRGTFRASAPLLPAEANKCCTVCSKALLPIDGQSSRRSIIGLVIVGFPSVRLCVATQSYLGNDNGQPRCGPRPTAPCGKARTSPAALTSYTTRWDATIPCISFSMRSDRGNPPRIRSRPCVRAAT